jgi:iron complex outermembrane recepter protein
MTRAPLFLLQLAALVALPAAATAQADTTAVDSTVYRIEGLSIQMQRPVTTIGGASAIEVEAEVLDLPASPTAGELLRALTGVHVRTNSRGQDEVSVRGSESRQVAIIFDGVPLTLAYDARTDVSVLPAAAFQDISFVRGLSTLLHGPNVLGGVVEMNLTGGGDRRVPIRRTVEFAASVDHVGGYSTGANGVLPFSTRGGEGAILLGGGYRDSPGVTLPGGVTEPVPGDDLRLNTDFSNLDGFLGVRYTTEDGAWTSLSATSHTGERGIAAELGAEDPRLWRYPSIRRTIVAASAGTGDRATPFGRGDLRVSLGFDDGITDIRSYQTRDYRELAGFENSDDRTLSLRVLGDHSLGQRGEIRSSFTWADIRHDENVDGDFRAFQQRLFSVAGETMWRLVDAPDRAVSSLRLSAGGAWDRGTTPVSGGLEPLPTMDDWGARVGLSALLGSGSTVIHAGASRRGRFPALREAYSEALDRFEPNPGLRPEHLFALEAGVTTRVGDGEVQFVGFRHELDGAIRRVSLPNGRRQRINSDRLLSQGVELFVSQALGEVELGGELTLQSVELVNPATSVNTNPENVPERFGTAHARFPVGSGFTSTLEAEYTGAQWCIDPDSGEDVRLDGGSWLNTALSKVWTLSAGRRIETRLSAANLADSALYDSCGLPRAGRLFRLQLRVF